jgi:hypothetical protein
MSLSPLFIDIGGNATVEFVPRFRELPSGIVNCT